MWQGIEDEPNIESDNLVKSRGIAINLLEPYPCYNIINPSDCLLKKYINGDGYISNAGTYRYAVCCVKANKNGIVTNFSSGRFPVFLVVNKSGGRRVIQSVGSTNTYTYQDDDSYLYIAIHASSISTEATKEDLINYITNNCMAVIGTELPDEFIHYGITKDTTNYVKNYVKKETVNLSNVLNYITENDYHITDKEKNIIYASNIGILKIDGTIDLTKTNYLYTDKIVLDGIDKIKYNHIWSAESNYSGLNLYDELNNVVLYVNNSSSGTISLKDYPTAQYIQISGYKSTHPYVTLFSNELKFKYLNNIIIVDKNGYGDFDSIDDAINHANDTQLNNVTIFVKPGTYSTHGERTDSRAPVQSHPYEMNYRNLTIIGLDRERCILRNDIGIYDTHNYDDSVLRLGGNITIKNLTLVSTHNDYDPSVEGAERLSAYCLHLDKNVNEGDVCVVENCTMVSENGPCIGSGLRNGYTIIVRNCSAKLTHYRNADKAYLWHGVLYFHGWQNAISGQSANLEIRNCVLENVLDQYSINIGGLSENDQIKYLLTFNSVKTSDTQNSLRTSRNVVNSALSFGNNVESMNYTV